MESKTNSQKRSRLKQGLLFLGWSSVVTAVALTTPLLRTETTKADAKSETVLPASIRPHTLVTINSKFPGQVMTVLVTAGAKVVAGDEVAKLSNPDFQLEYERAQAHLLNVEEKLARKQSERLVEDPSAGATRALAAARDRLSSFSVAESEAAYSKAAANVNKLELLAQQQLATEAEVDQARRTAEAELRNLHADKEHISRLNEEVESAKSRVSNLRGQFSSSESDAVNLMMELREAKEQVRIAAERCKSEKIVATTSGVVLKTFVNVGDEIPSGVPLLQVAQLDRLDLDVPVDAEVAQRIKVGQNVGVRIPTEPPTHIVAPVSAVMLIPAQDQSAYTVRITTANPSLSARLVGLTGQVEFPHARTIWHALQF